MLGGSKNALGSLDDVETSCIATDDGEPSSESSEESEEEDPGPMGDDDIEAGTEEDPDSGDGVGEGGEED